MAAETEYERSQYDEVSMIDINENSSVPGLGFRPSSSALYGGSPPLWTIATNAGISGASFVSQAFVVLIAKGLEGDFSAKTLMWVQALFECLKRVFNSILPFQREMREYFLLQIEKERLRNRKATANFNHGKGQSSQ